MKPLRNPMRLVPSLFLLAIALGTFVLCLPISTANGTGAPLLTALFTATSAVAVTGLVVVDTGSYWSPVGQVFILLMFQIGGLGIMTAATLLGLIAGRGFGLNDRMATQVERGRLDTDDALSVLKLVFVITVVVETVAAAVLALRFILAYGMTPAEALWHAVFHAVSAFNNAGFSINADGLVGYQFDPFVLGPVMLAVVIGALGFPVMQDLHDKGADWRRWSLHSKMTVAGSAALLALGCAAILAMEWDNPATLGPMGWGAKLLNAAFHSAMPRTAGFNSLDVGTFRHETLMVNYLLMFVGGGSAGTAGGIKVTTFIVLFAIVLSEILGRRDSGLFNRRFGSDVERQALTVTVLAATMVFAATTFIAAVSDLPLPDILFECISAFATVGLSTGITAELPPGAQVAIIMLMFVGRVGTITVATALAVGRPPRPYRFPKETVIVG
ncbi:TrkH family potassium uptake protein [Erythrobacter sp. NE805]|uniref:TrkH family potassium uptake protein n=1 Tax=Erythrobacter sp. NE805 TaxID=3389875 RepID=UPI00396B054C